MLRSDQIVRLRVVFDDNVKKREIHTVLQGIRGKILDGPTDGGFYLVEAPNSTDPWHTVRILRHFPTIVRFAEPSMR